MPKVETELLGRSIDKKGANKQKRCVSPTTSHLADDKCDPASRACKDQAICRMEAPDEASRPNRHEATSVAAARPDESKQRSKTKGRLVVEQQRTQESGSHRQRPVRFWKFISQSL